MGKDRAIKISNEQLDLLNAELTVVFLIGVDAATVTGDKLFQAVPSVRAGLVAIMTDRDVSTAFSSNSVAGHPRPGRPRTPRDLRRRHPNSGPTHTPDMIELTMNEIRRPINVLPIRPTRSIAYRLRRSNWRRRHQARARQAHCTRRLNLEFQP